MMEDLSDYSNLFFLFDTVTQNPENQNLKSTDVSEIPSNVHRSSIKRHFHYDYINAVIENKIIFKSCFSFLQSNKKVFFLKIFTSKGKIDMFPTLDERF